MLLKISMEDLKLENDNKKWTLKPLNRLGNIKSGTFFTQSIYEII
jgi:hypothetical protein